MKKFKSISLIILCFALILTFCNINISADQNGLSDTLIKNSVRYMTSTRGTAWNDIVIVEKTPLYNFDEKLIASSIDIFNSETSEKGYIILSNMEDDGLIYEFAIGVNSPYYKMTKDEENTFLYNGVMDYYVKNIKTKDNQKTEKYLKLKENTELTSDEIDSYKKNDKEKVYKSNNQQQAKALRSILASDELTQNLIISPMSVSSRILSAPDYYWLRGCSPTSAAMVMRYRYPGALPTTTTLINDLASAMGTDSQGGTQIPNIPAGINTVAYNNLISVNSYNDGSRKAYSTLSEYCLEINNDRPVVVTVMGSTQTAPHYPAPDGFGNHTMAGVGYYKDVYANFIVVHDTGSDGDVYCDYDASNFGTPTWTYVK